METVSKTGGKRKQTEDAQSSVAETPLEVDADASNKQIVLKEGQSLTNPKQATEEPKGPATKKSKTEPTAPPPTADFLSGHNLALVPPGIVNKLANAQVIGHVRPLSERIMDARFYTLRLDNIRAIITKVLTESLNRCYHDKGKLIKTAASTEIAKVVPLTVDACMIALYAKLRTIHKQYGTYSSRFTTPASYNKDIELPLPLADAISDIGIFETTCADKCYVFVPVVPEGTKHECRANEEWHSYKYESCIQIFKDMNIPCRNVDTRLKSGTAWWTYKTKYEYGMFSGTMIVPPLHYSDNSATVASMFLMLDSNEALAPIVTFLTDDEDYGNKFQLLRPGVQMRAFMALIAKPNEDWNAGSTFE